MRIYSLKNLMLACIVFSLNLLPTSVFAAINQEPSWDFLLNTGLTYGGDKTSNVSGVEGEIQGGNFYYLGGGFDWPIIQRLRLLTNFGYHLDSDDSDDSSSKLNFTRFAVEAIPYFQISKHIKLGAGATFHSHNKLESKSNGDTIVFNFDDALGLTAFIGYNVEGTRSWVELRYTNIKYSLVKLDTDITTEEGRELDGSHIAFIIHWALI